MSTNAPGSTASADILAENANPAATVAEPPAVTPPPTIVTVDTLSFHAALMKYVKVVANKNARLLVQGIRISAAGDYLDLFGTDLEVSLRLTVPANAITTRLNTIVADYKALLNAVKAVKDRQTRLTLYREHLTVSDSASSIHVASVGEVEDFPQPSRRLTLQECLATREANAPAYQKQNAVEFEKIKKSWRETLPLEFQDFAVSAAALSAALRYVLPGMAVGDMRYALNGVFMTGNNRGGAEFVTSNIHVLYRHDATLTGGTLPDNAGFIMLPKMIEWLAKNANGTLTVKTDPNTVFFEGDGFILAGRRIEGIFPRYRDLILAQRAMPGRLAVNRKELLATLKAARPNTNSETRRIDLAPNAEGNGLIVRTICGSAATFTVEISAASRKWLTDSFNVDFLIDFLTVHPGDTVTICHDEAGAKDSGGPSAVYDGERLFLIMSKLSATLSKKVPIPDLEYSSQQFSCGLDLELSGEQTQDSIRQKIRNLYALLHAAIDEEIEAAIVNPPVFMNTLQITFHGGGEVDNSRWRGRSYGDNRQSRWSKPSGYSRYGGGRQANGRATQAQVKAIFAISKANGIERGVLHEMLEDKFNVTQPDDLSVRQASKLIETLKEGGVRE